MQTKQEKDLEKSPFYELFQRRPWLVPLLGLVNRFVGNYREFHEINIKPHIQAQRRNPDK
jgi:hypothetical protein